MRGWFLQLYPRGLPAFQSPRAQCQDAARAQHQKKRQILEEIARTQVNTVIEIAHVAARCDQEDDQQKPVSFLRSPGEKRHGQEDQGEIAWPAEKIGLQTGQQLVQIDKTSRQRMRSVEAHA